MVCSKFASGRLILALLLALLTSSFADSNVGCTFSPRVCEDAEECFDDNVFGRCQLPLQLDLYRHQLNPETIRLLVKELDRLLAGGYKWWHEYTQCVVQNILYSNRNSISYDPGLCSRRMQITLPDIPPELIADLQSLDPDELASITFNPKHDKTESDIFADEIFSPPLFSERNPDNEEKKKKRDPIPKETTIFGHHHKLKQQSSFADKEELLQELLKAAQDTDALLRGLNVDSADRYPDKNIPVIKTDLSSDLNQAPAYTEGGVEWFPAPENMPEFIEPYDKKRVRVHEQYQEDEKPKVYEKVTDNRKIEPIKPIDHNPTFVLPEKPQMILEQKNRHVYREEIPTFGRDNEDGQTDEEDRNFHWNAKHRTKTMDDDLTKFADKPRRRFKVKEDSADSSNLSDVIENDYLEDQLYAILPGANKGRSPNDKRYDIKKPGPTYMIHEDEDGIDEDSNVLSNELIDRLSHDSWSDENPMFAAPSDQQVNPFVHRYEATDEFSRVLITSSNGEPERVPENVPVMSEVPDARLSADQPELLEGIEPGDKDRTSTAAKTGEGHIGHRYDSVDATRTNLAIKEKDVTEEKAQKLVKALEKYLSLDRGSLSNIKVKGQEISFKVNPNSKGYNASEVATKAEDFATQLKDNTGLTVEEAGIGDKVKYEVLHPNHDRRLVIMTLSLCGAVAGLLLTAIAAFFLRRHTRTQEKISNIAHPDTEASQDYQDLCRQRMASKCNSTEKPEPVTASPSQKQLRSLSQEASTSSHSSTSSWNEEPVTSNMDISTGHMILSYMEDHLKNKDRLDREWEALCAYEVELCATNTAALQINAKKNRYTDVLPYDHSRVVLNELINVSGSDYINASSITDHDPRNPAYIATQGPLPQTGADFWQMIWEQGSVVIVMLSRLMENGVAMCHRYWPEEGSEVYHIYEVHLVSEHIWCDDYLVRSFYLKNLKTSETRTVTQFHFMSWPDNGVPNSTRALLDFRRKVNKSYRGRSCPIVVHCSDGIGRTGTYCLIDMVLNRMAKGAKEIDIAATLEHVRDQRVGMVKTKTQFEFVLMAIAEEVHAILKALSH